VISINTLHNLPYPQIIKGLREIERVSRGKNYVVVDSYYSCEEKKLFEGVDAHCGDLWLSGGMARVCLERRDTIGNYSWNLMA